jgi:ribosomal protein L3 glutamine methyltransferase
MIKEEIFIKDIFKVGNKIFKKAKVHPHFYENNTLDANVRAIIEHVLQRKNIDKSEKVTYQEYLKILNLINTRANSRMPIEYLINKTIYCGNHFYVNEHVLVPRSIMSNRFNEFLESIEWTNYNVLDLCTGSGCIGITLALMNNKINVDLADVCNNALDVANANVKFHNLDKRVNIIQSDLFENITKSYDLIISNPPYVSNKIYKNIPQEFKNEPKIALLSGKTGTEIIEKIINNAKNYLTPNGKLIIEVGYDTPKKIKKKFPKYNFTWLTYKRKRNTIIQKIMNKFIDLPGILLASHQDLIEK